MDHEIYTDLMTKVRAHHWVEVRRAEFDRPGLKPRFDELVTGPVDAVHIEQMNDSTYWMSITKGDESQIVIFSAVNGRSHVAARTESD